MFWNFVIHQIFSEFLQPLRDLRIQRVAKFYRGLLFVCFWSFLGLGVIRSPWSIINRIWHLHWRDITLNPISSLLTLNFTYCRWRRRGWRRWGGMTLLSRMCLWRRWRSRGRTWQAWNHNRNEILRIANYPNPVLNEMWFLTVDPFVGISVFIVKLSER